MTLLDYFYYLAYKFYSKHKEKGAQSTSAGIVGALQALNVLTIIWLFELLSGRKMLIDKLVAIGLFIVFQATTYYRYVFRDKPSISDMERKWMAKTDQSRTQIRLLVFLYGVLSIVGCFGLAIYLGARS